MIRDQISDNLFRVVVAFGFALFIYAGIIAARVGALALLWDAVT